MARRFEFYKITRGINLADAKVWNTRFEDIDLRLAEREDDASAIDDAIETLLTTGLARLDDTFTPLIQEAQQALSTYGISFSGLSASEVTIGTGEKSFTLTAGTKDAFYYADYVSIRSVSTPTATMLATVTSYVRATGVLMVDVISTTGSGTHDDWDVHLGAPPDETHATRTDNPHSVTAAQVGTLTTAQINAAIAAAIAALPPLTTALLKANNLSDLTDVVAARTALGLGALALASSIGTGDFASNVRATQALAEAGTDNVTLMTPLRVAQHAAKARVVTIPDQAGPTFDAQSGLTQIARLSASASRTLVAPTNPVDGQKVIIEHYASGGSRTLGLTVGSANAFRFGTDLTGLTATTSGKIDRVGVIYRADAQRWDVVGAMKGF